MAGGVVCYLERFGAGSQIRRVRLVAAGLVRVWTAPEAGSVSSVDGPGPALSGTKAAAAFVAQTLASVGLKRLACVCVDADGSVCAWLSALSPESTVIQATIQESSGDGDGTGAGVGAARLLSMTSSSGGGFGSSDVTMQALAVAEPEARAASPSLTKQLTSKLARRDNGSAANATGGLTRKSRYAVLAIPDAPVRVFLDELDRVGVEVETVRSLWHGLAEAWDPVADRGPSNRGGRTSVFDSQSPAAGVVMVDPSGKLVWAWTLGSELVAGGSMRLASFAKSDAPPAPSESPVDAPVVDGSRRLIVASVEVEPPQVISEFSSADAGRLVMDWLAWSAQLGHCPRRIVCISPPNLGSHTSNDGPRVLPALLAKCWPGATVDAVVHDDPVGATLARMAGLGPTETSPTIDTPTLTGARHELVGLSARPGRADRSLHRWIAVALFGLAGIIGVGAWQVYRSAGDVSKQVEAVKLQRVGVLDEMKVILRDDGFPRMPPEQQKDRIASEIKAKRDTLRNLKPPRPVIEEAVRLLQALDGVKDVTLGEFEVNPILVKAILIVPDAETGPLVLERLSRLPGDLNWDGTTPAFRREGQRQYVLIGTWGDGSLKPKPAPAAAGAAGAKP